MSVASAVSGLSARIDQVRSAGARRCESRPVGAHLLRAWRRFSGVDGGQRAAAVTYFGFLSFFPLVALAFAVMGYVIEWYPQVHADLTHGLSRALPGLVGPGPHQVNVDDIASARSGAGLLGLAGLIWSGTAWIEALREALRRVFGHEPDDDTNWVLRRLRDIAVLGVLGGTMLLSVALSAVGTIATDRIVDAAGYADDAGVQWLIRAGALVFAVGGSTVLFAVMFLGMSGTRIPGRALWRGALLAALGYEILKVFATLLLGHTMRNPVYATFSVAVGLLVWINLVTRATLMAAAWTATTGSAVRASDRLAGRKTDAASAEGAAPPVASAHS